MSEITKDTFREIQELIEKRHGLYLVLMTFIDDSNKWVITDLLPLDYLVSLDLELRKLIEKRRENERTK
jgi:hypothetical protein